MKILAIIRTVLFFIVIASSGCITAHKAARENQPKHIHKPYVILISIDGYRRDYTDLFFPPRLHAFRETGSSASGLLPVYPSKTFTNHLSIATGLYAENHGIVSNSFYDPQRKQFYRISDRDAVSDGTWYSGEPIWVGAEKQGMVTATYYWPGSEAAIQGVHPSHYYRYSEDVTPKEQVAQAIEWLKLPLNERPHFITLYFPWVDQAGHRFGPHSPEVRKAIFKIDTALGTLFDEIKNLELPVNTIIVSDHGMQDIDVTKVEYLDDYINLQEVKLSDVGVLTYIHVQDPSKVDSIYKKLKESPGHFKTYKRSELPEALHISKSPRVGDIILIEESPYYLSTRNPTKTIPAGDHGYDVDTTPSMQAIFYAKGPQIEPGVRLPAFQNIHIYPLIMKILGLNPATQIDGQFKIGKRLYKDY